MAFSIGTWLYTQFFGECVGEDAHGNRYYRGQRKDGIHVGRADKERRWVVYKGIAEPSKIPPYWHSWMHYMTDTVPTEEDQQAVYTWEKPHLPNLTGTSHAYRPPGHIAKGGKRDAATGDYVPWQPNTQSRNTKKKG